MRDLLVDLGEGVFDLLVTGGVLFVVVSPPFEGLDLIQTGSADVVITTGKSALAVDTVAFDGDGIEAVRSGVLCGRDEILTNDGAAKDLIISIRSRLMKSHSPARKP